MRVLSLEQKMDLRKNSNGKISAMEDEFKSWENTFKLISKYVVPSRGRYKGDRTNDGKRRDIYQIDGTSWQAARTMASGMQGGLTSPGRPWFKLGVPKDRELAKYKPINIWLQDLADLFYSIFNISNVYSAFYNVYEECGSFATSAMFVGEDLENIIMARTFTAGEFSISLDRRLMPNSFHLQNDWTVSQLVNEFGLENLSNSTKSLYNTNKTEEYVKVNWLIEPNNDRQLDLKDNTNMKFRSLWWEEGSNNTDLLRFSGFRNFPMMVPRWGTISNDAYGNGCPGIMSLGAAKMLQKLNEKGLIGLDKMIDPPMVGSGLSRRNKTSLIPGAVTIIDSNAGVFQPAYQINLAFQDLEYKADQVRRYIKECYFNDLFMMLAMQNGKYMTATEVAERHEEKLIMLGPVLDRLYFELLNPTIDRVFDICQELNILPPPPPEMVDMDIDIEYTSVLAQAQKMIGTKSLEQFVAFGGSLIEPFPTIADNMNTDEIIRIYAKWLGVPAEVINDEDTVEAIRQSRQAKENMAMNAEVGLQAAQGAKLMSETDTTKDSALTALMGGISK